MGLQGGVHAALPSVGPASPEAPPLENWPGPWSRGPTRWAEAEILGVGWGGHALCLPASSCRAVGPLWGGGEGQAGLPWAQGVFARADGKPEEGAEWHHVHLGEVEAPAPAAPGEGLIAPRGGHWAVQGSQPSREGNQGGPVTPQACSSRLPAQGKPCWSPRPTI